MLKNVKFEKNNFERFISCSPFRRKWYDYLQTLLLTRFFFTNIPTTLPICFRCLQNDTFFLAVTKLTFKFQDLNVSVINLMSV
jgi:hypothetical protein